MKIPPFNPLNVIASKALSANALHIGGFVPLTTQDFPNRLACVVFVAGCPWRCPYCHNPHLQSRHAADTQPDITWNDVLSFLVRRVGLLDGVVFSGGEPLTDPALKNAIDDVKARGFQVGLHTGGCFPDRLKSILGQVDWIGLDVKTEPDHYDELTHAKHSGQSAFESLEAVLAYQKAHPDTLELECRVTVSPEWLPEDRLLSLAERLHNIGVTKFVLQPYRPVPDLNLPFNPIPLGYPSKALQERLTALFPEYFIR